MKHIDTETAWAGGLFEGEGSFTYLTNGNIRYLRVALQMGDRDVIERFREAVGFGAIYEVRPDPRNPNGRPMVSWQAHGEGAFRHIFDTFRPYLSERRKARAVELLSELGRIHPDQAQMGV